MKLGTFATALVRLDQRIRERVSRLIEEGFVVLVGDANGADKAIQEFFAERAYPNVVVYHAGSKLVIQLQFAKTTAFSALFWY